MILRCYGCGKGFEWKPIDATHSIAPAYHSKGCKDRNRIKLRTTIPIKCPRPEKKVYDSHTEAQAVANKIGKDNNTPALNVYRCVCGGLHIGNNGILIKGKKQ